jgi:hypothetical protein
VLARLRAVHRAGSPRRGACTSGRWRWRRQAPFLHEAAATLDKTWPLVSKRMGNYDEALRLSIEALARPPEATGSSVTASRFA